MESIAVYPLLVVFTVSCLIAIWAASRRVGDGVEEYLFAGNNPVLAISSELGSLFSLSICCTALLSGGFIYGWQILIPLYLAIGAAGLTIAKASTHHDIEFSTRSGCAEGFRRGASIFTALGAIRGNSVTIVYSLVALVFYLLLLTTELIIARVFLVEFTGATGVPLYLALTLLVGTCFVYVFVGGYRGVLYTDHFQLIVIVALTGALFGSQGLGELVADLPSPLASLVPSDLLSNTVLHASVFLGAYLMLVGNADQWIRIVGTLKPSAVKSTVTWAFIVFGLGAGAPILIGSAAHTTSRVPAGVTNEAALYMIHNFLANGATGTRFLFFLFLACVLLTTIDTYLITLQQLYYELSVRVRASTYRGYLVEYLVKWKQIRELSFVFLVAVLVVSLSLPAERVYAIGVFALTGAIFWAPSLLVELLPQRFRAAIAAKTQVASLLLGLGLFPFLALSLRSYFGPLNDNLHLIFGAAAVAALVSHTVILSGCHVYHRYEAREQDQND